MGKHVEKSDEIMTPGEVAQAFGVDVKTVTRWARAGKLAHFTTLGGHRRYLRTDIEQFRRLRRD